MVFEVQEQGFPPFSARVLMARRLRVFLEAVLSVVQVLPLVADSSPLAAQHPVDGSSVPHAGLPVFQFQRRAEQRCQTCIQAVFFPKSQSLPRNERISLKPIFLAANAPQNRESRESPPPVFITGSSNSSSLFNVTPFL